MTTKKVNTTPITGAEGQQPPGGIPPKQPNTNAEKKEIQTSFLDYNGWLFEEVYHDGVASFACWDGQQVSYCDRVVAPTVEYVPILDDRITKQVISLPQKAQDYGNTVNLLDEIRAFIHKYADISPADEYWCSWYVLHTHIYDKLRTSPLLRFIGDIGCGKSRCLETIGGLCYKPISMSGAITIAPIFRMIETFKGTVIIDEADWSRSDAQHFIVKILNNGFQQTSTVTRCKPNNPCEIDAFSIFCPKVLATRYGFNDQALESRCIIVRMEETGRDDIPTLLNPTMYANQLAIRNKLLMFRLKNLASTSIEEIDLPIDDRRVRQTVMPLAQPLINFPDELTRLKQLVIDFAKENVKVRADSPEGLVVNALIQIVDSGEKVITSDDVSKEIAKASGNPTKTGMTASRVGTILRSLGIDRELKRVNGVPKRVIKIDNVKLTKLKRKYVIPLEGQTNDNEADVLDGSRYARNARNGNSDTEPSAEGKEADDDDDDGWDSSPI